MRKMLSEKSVRVRTGRTVLPESVRTGRTVGLTQRMLSGYGRVPLAVTSDRRLKDRDVRVYAGLAALERAGRVNNGVRLIAEASAKGKTVTADSLKRLVDRGHVDRDNLTRGGRATYHLTSQVFRKNVEQVSATSAAVVKNPGAPRVKLCKCLSCPTLFKSRKNVDRCLNCRRDDRAKKVAQKAAREEVKAVLRA